MGANQIPVNENKYDDIFKKYGASNNFDWLLLKAQVKAESNFNPNAVSPVGAKGLSQFMTKTWLEWEDGSPGIQNQNRDFDPFNPDDSIRVQACYMNYLKKQMSKLMPNNSYIIEWSLSCYNYGIGLCTKLIKENNNFNEQKSKLPKETRDYVERIMKYYRTYINLTHMKA